MYWDVIDVKPLENYSIKVKFRDNLEGVVNISSKWLTGIFAPLINKNIFNQVYVDNDSCAVTWDINGEQIDLAPDTMYKEIKQNNGIYVLE